MSSNKILFIDAYDSFSTNIIALVSALTGADVDCIKHDHPSLINSDDCAFVSLLQQYVAVVAGPGPGDPSNFLDVGAIARLWCLPISKDLPVLGICLGFQSLALANGASAYRLKLPKHGMVAHVNHNRRDIFEDAKDVTAMQYNSLAVDLGHQPGEDIWLPSVKCPIIQPLAWSLLDRDNGPVCMAIRHSVKPHWGLQYHPESILTNESGAKVIKSWWRFAVEFNRCTRLSLNALDYIFGTMKNGSTLPPQKPRREPQQDLPPEKYVVQTIRIPLGRDSVLDVAGALSDGLYEPVILASGTTADGVPVNSETGRYSIVGVVDSEQSQVLEYNVHSQQLIRRSPDGSFFDQQHVDDIWKYLKFFMQHHRARPSPHDIPFWGGLVGFASYEACLPSTGVEPQRNDDDRPDVCFVFVERSAVIDHVEKQIYVQSIAEQDTAWLAHASKRILSRPSTARPPSDAPIPPPTSINSPTRDAYMAKVDACKAHIRAGNAYELCLTAPTDMHYAPSAPSPAPPALYRALLARNPAPFSAYLHVALHAHRSSVAVLASSPERFLAWSRAGAVQLRPIKGTVRKTPGSTLASAAAALASPKERAENVMIVDLVRHDLAAALGPSAPLLPVRVPALCKVEEYATVYQSVSVIETPAAPALSGAGPAVLGATLPPGSMTGAPKRRACELLKRLEARPRGVYAGVLGYMDVGGGGDFAVVIRTAVRWRRGGGDAGGGAEGAGDTWTVGAGGAVTVLSDAAAEWDEMCAKREAVVGVFTGGRG